jgi:hypothetical protein
MASKRHQAPWGVRVRLITVGLLVFAVLLAAILPWVVTGTDAWVVAWVVPGVFLATLGGTALFMVRGYELTDDSVTVRRSFWVDRLPLSGLVEVKVDPEALSGAWKTVGNDGLFAIHGWFRSKRLGKFRAFVTDPANTVVMRYQDRTVVISPEHPRRFAEDVRRRIEGRKGAR